MFGARPLVCRQQGENNENTHSPFRDHRSDSRGRTGRAAVLHVGLLVGRSFRVVLRDGLWNREGGRKTRDEAVRMTAKERRDAERASLLDKAAALDESGAVVSVPGTLMKLEDVPPGTRVRTGTGVELRLEYLSLGSACVTVLGGTNPDWRKGERTTIAPSSIVEVM
jgi:hypothetical protein